MLNECEKRAAVLVVSRYGADWTRVNRVVQSVLEIRAQGDSADLLDSFQREKLLTASQVRELRFGLEKTRVETVDKNGTVAPAPISNGPALALVADGPDDELAVDLIELRALGDFRILRRLGAGGTGAVFLAYDGEENRQVALKVLDPQLAKSQSALDRFNRETKSGALLKHPNIIQNFGGGQDQQTGLHYMILEYIDGPNALDLLDKYQRLSVGDAVHIALDIAKALEHAHARSIVHRDIKPGNILITLSGLAKLGDMGLAKRTDEVSHLTRARQGFGTPYYMPYEQAMDARSADHRSDIYALGATLYHLVTGEVPFPGANSLEIVDKKAVGTFTPASQINSDIPHALDHILAKMMARDPRARYQTASELIVDLDRSNLAAALPSFIDPDRALQDPVVRQRLAAPAATCPDLRPGIDRPLDADPIWYLRYPDRHGQICKAKATFDQIAQKLRDGKLTSQAEVARSPQGIFQPLATYPAFQEVLQALSASKIDPVPAKEDTLLSKAHSLNIPIAWWIALASGIGMALLLIVTLILWWRG
jgi:eukaryotic-like serine/threonine-protein kinase